MVVHWDPHYLVIASKPSVLNFITCPAVVPGPKQTFLLLAVHLQGCGNTRSFSIFRKKIPSFVLHMVDATLVAVHRAPPQEIMNSIPNRLTFITCPTVVPGPNTPLFWLMCS